jgi:hypothetical protein|tara:strand:+ start:655 stop:1032 length:378 start_codon:yes stop_codon:yes gene_type:complete
MVGWEYILKKDSDYKKGRGYRNASPEKQKEIDRVMEREAKKAKALLVPQFKAMLRMTFGKHGKDSKEVQELGEKFMASNPTEEQIDEIMDYFEKLEDKPKPRTAMDELREKQKRAKKELDSKRDR